MDDKKLFTHILINALPGEPWPLRNAAGQYLSGCCLYQHRFVWSSPDGWLFTGLQATIEGDERLRALVQNQLYVQFLCGDKVQTTMCGVHLVEDVDRRFLEANVEMTERRVITEAEVPNEEGRAPVLHGRLCIPIAVPPRQVCELIVELHDCCDTSLARELMHGGRRLIAIDVYGIDMLKHESTDLGGSFRWAR